MRPRLALDPASLAHRLALQQPVETTDAQGGLDVTWVTVANIWCALRPVRLTEETRAHQQIEDIFHDITCRFRTDIESGWRFALDGRTFTILSVHDPDERRAYLVCRTRSEGR
ncbi:MAG: phage head closure protein [Pseudomonadota bacterium]